MKKLLFLIAAAMIALLPSCSNEEPAPEPTSFLTRAELTWYNSYIEALDDLMEGSYAGDDDIYFALLNSNDAKKYLTTQAYESFVKSASSQESDWSGSGYGYGWEQTAYVVQITYDWVYDDKGKKLYPMRVENLLYVLYRGGKNYMQFAYGLAEGVHEYTWHYDPK